MKALRLQLYQETACYKKPMAFKVAETYPLPPYSTVKGALHALVDAKSFIPMSISVQGEYETILVDYQKHYFYKKADQAQFPLVMAGLEQQYEYDANITAMPIYAHMLYNTTLVIHVSADDETLLKLQHAVETMTTTLSLGRHEDIVRVDECKVVDIVKSSEAMQIPYHAYVPRTVLSERKQWTPYKLNFKYEVKQGVREWEKISVGYVQKGMTFTRRDQLYVDSDNFPVFLHDQSKEE